MDAFHNIRSCALLRGVCCLGRQGSSRQARNGFIYLLNPFSWFAQYHVSSQSPFTCSIARYSTRTDKTFTPRVVHTATSVDRASTREITTGATSLQIRSMRLMEAFKSAGLQSQFHHSKAIILSITGSEPCLGISRLPEITTTCWMVNGLASPLKASEDIHTQSRSTATVFTTEANFSAHASRVTTRKRMGVTRLDSGDARRTTKHAQDIATGIRCQTKRCQPEAFPSSCSIVHIPIDCLKTASLFDRSTTSPSQEDKRATNNDRTNA